MKTTVRFEDALRKLYMAFHNNQLNPECCKQCAVGNILDNNDHWKHLSDNHGSLTLNYIGRVHQSLGRQFNGYSPLELLQIEKAFLRGCGYELPIHYNHKKPKNPTDMDTLFKGLCEVVQLLCDLDGMENIMDYSRLFNFQIKPSSKSQHPNPIA